MTRRLLILVALAPFLVASQADDTCQAGGPELVVSGTVLEVRDRQDGDPGSGAPHDPAARSVRLHVEHVASGEAPGAEIAFDLDDHLGKRDLVAGATAEFRLARIHMLTSGGTSDGPWVAFACYDSAPPGRGGCAGCGGR
jgi:hypothetical protein